MAQQPKEGRRAPRLFREHLDDHSRGPDDELTVALHAAANAANAARYAVISAQHTRLKFAAGAGADLTGDEWQEVSARVGERLAELRTAMVKVNEQFGLSSAQVRLLRYFRSHLNEVISGDALAGVSAIYEWARRVRELRVEHGWRIASGLTREDMHVDEYVLSEDKPDEDLAGHWRLAKEIRSRPGAGQDRALAYLQAIFPAAADQEQMLYVSRISSWSRRMRELDEQGWEIPFQCRRPRAGSRFVPPGYARA